VKSQALISVSIEKNIGHHRRPSSVGGTFREKKGPLLYDRKWKYRGNSKTGAVTLRRAGGKQDTEKTPIEPLDGIWGKQKRVVQPTPCWG